MAVFTSKLNKLLKEPRENRLGVLLSSAVNILITHPIILYPLCLYAFLQLLILEILYFSACFPLSLFFAPLIKRLWSDAFLHYPFNFILLPKLFYYSQVPVYITLGAFLTAMTVTYLVAVNNEKKISFRLALKDSIGSYIYILIAAFVSFILISLASKGYQYALVKIAQANIGVSTGTGQNIAGALQYGQPYFHFLAGIIITAAFAFVVPVILIEKKKILQAFAMNFSYLKKSYWFILLVVLLPSLFYIPLLVLRTNMGGITSQLSPEFHAVIIVISIIATLLIDGIILTATTIFYLHQRELQ